MENNFRTFTSYMKKDDELLQERPGMSFQQYTDWTGVTLLKDAVSPFTGKKFEDSYRCGVTNGQASVTVWPFFEEGTRTIGAWDTTSFIGAFLDAFGLQRYSVLKVGYHERYYSRALPIERNVLSRYDGNRWVRLSYVNGKLEERTPRIVTPVPGQPADPRANAAWSWMSKHREVDVLLNCYQQGHPYRAILFQDWQVARWERIVSDRLNLTIAECLKLRNEDWATAQSADALRRAEKLGLTTGNGDTILTIDGKDLKDLGFPLTVWVKAPKTGAYPMVFVSVEKVQAALGPFHNQPDYSFSLVKPA